LTVRNKESGVGEVKSYQKAGKRRLRKASTSPSTLLTLKKGPGRKTRRLQGKKHMDPETVSSNAKDWRKPNERYTPSPILTTRGKERS